MKLLFILLCSLIAIGLVQSQGIPPSNGAPYGMYNHVDPLIPGGSLGTLFAFWDGSFEYYRDGALLYTGYLMKTEGPIWDIFGTYYRYTYYCNQNGRTFMLHTTDKPPSDGWGDTPCTNVYGGMEPFWHWGRATLPPWDYDIFPYGSKQLVKTG